MDESRVRATGIPASLLVQGAWLLAAFLGLDWWIRGAARLPAESYESPFLSAEIVLHLDALRSTVLAVALLVLTWRCGRSLFGRWPEFEPRAPVRILAALVIVILAWSFSSYDYNLYLDRSHGADRILLLTLGALACWRPVFILPFVVLTGAIVGQLDHPFPAYSPAEAILLLRILVLSLSLFLVNRLTKATRLEGFAVLLICLLAAPYWASGVGKAPHHWLLEDHVEYLLPATHANGWLASLGPDTIASITSFVAHLAWPMKLATIVVECGALFVLWRRGSVLFFLGGWIAFHAGVFALSGICFWKWVVVELALFVFFLRARRERIPRVFTPVWFVVSVALIVASPWWCAPVKLAWYDARASYAYRFDAVGDRGGRGVLAPRFFAPYDYPFTLGLFAYLEREPTLPIAWGATTREVAAALREVGDFDDLRRLERSKGRVRFDADRAATFDRFVRRFVQHFNRDVSRRTRWRPLQPPRWLWTFPKGERFAETEKIRAVIVTRTTSLFDGTRYRESRSGPVRIVNVPRDARDDEVR